MLNRLFYLIILIPNLSLAQVQLTTQNANIVDMEEMNLRLNENSFQVANRISGGSIGYTFTDQNLCEWGFVSTDISKIYQFEESFDGGRLAFGRLNNVNHVLLKTDNSGNILWQKEIGNNIEFTENLVEDSNGNIFLCSYDNVVDSVLIIKFDSDGNTIWSKNTFAINPNLFIKLKIIGNNLCFATYDSSNIFVNRLDLASGSSLPIKVFNLSNEIVYAANLDSLNGSYYIYGNNQNISGPIITSSVYLIKLDTNFEVISGNKYYALYNNSIYYSFFRGIRDKLSIIDSCIYVVGILDDETLPYYHRMVMKINVNDSIESLNYYANVPSVELSGLREFDIYNNSFICYYMSTFNSMTFIRGDLDSLPSCNLEKLESIFTEPVLVDTSYSVTNINYSQTFNLTNANINYSLLNAIILDTTCNTLANNISELDYSAEIQTFPNPADEFLFIVGDQEFINEIEEIEIYNINGKIINSYTYIIKEAKINLKLIDSGFYIIKYKTKTGFFYSKFIKS